MRGRRGYLLTRRLDQGIERELAWVERGRVYSIGSGTPRTVGLKRLRSLATGLDRLGAFYIGTADPRGSTEASALTTGHTISVLAVWDAQCTRPGSTEPTPRVGNARVLLAPRRGNTFSFDIAQNREGEDPWTGTVSGTISRDSVAVNIRATGSIEGESCDSGPLSFSIPRSR